MIEIDINSNRIISETPNYLMRSSELSARSSTLKISGVVFKSVQRNTGVLLYSLCRASLYQGSIFGVLRRELLAEIVVESALLLLGKFRI